MVELRPITEENFEDCINLDVREEQQDFIAENMCSLAEAYVALPARSFRCLTAFMMQSRITWSASL